MPRSSHFRPSWRVMKWRSGRRSGVRAVGGAMGGAVGGGRLSLPALAEAKPRTASHSLAQPHTASHSLAHAAAAKNLSPERSISKPGEGQCRGLARGQVGRARVRARGKGQGQWQGLGYSMDSPPIALAKRAESLARTGGLSQPVASTYRGCRGVCVWGVCVWGVRRVCAVGVQAGLQPLHLDRQLL